MKSYFAKLADRATLANVPAASPCMRRECLILSKTVPANRLSYPLWEKAHALSLRRSLSALHRVSQLTIRESKQSVRWLRRTNESHLSQQPRRPRFNRSSRERIFQVSVLLRTFHLANRNPSRIYHERPLLIAKSHEWPC